MATTTAGKLVANGVTRIDPSEYLELKKRADRLRQDADRAQGALAGAMERLKTEFGCEDLAAADNMLEELRTKEEEATAEYNWLLVAFKSEWQEKLEAVEL